MDFTAEDNFEVLDDRYSMEYREHRFSYAEELQKYKEASRIANGRLDFLTILSRTILRELDAIRSQETALNSSDVDLPSELQSFEESLIRRALIRAGGRQTEAAKRLGIKNTTLNAKLKRFGIDPLGTYNDAMGK